MSSIKTKLVELESQLQSPEVWANQKLASELGQQVREIKDTISLFESWDSVIEDAQTAQEIGDEELIQESDKALLELEKQLDKYDIQQMLFNGGSYAAQNKDNKNRNNQYNSKNNLNNAENCVDNFHLEFPS